METMIEAVIVMAKIVETAMIVVVVMIVMARVVGASKI